jgi:DNA-binding IclR family transcriptional regulator
VRCVAAPIRDQDHKVIAAIGVSAPASRFPKARQRTVARHVRDAAAAITAALHVDPE